MTNEVATFDGLPTRIALLEEKLQLVSRIGELEKDLAIMEANFHASEKAKELQATEYERRLQDLNHAHATAREKEADFLLKDTYEKSERELTLWRRDVDETLTTVKSRRDTYLSMVAAVISLITLGIYVWSTFMKVPNG